MATFNGSTSTVAIDFNNGNAWGVEDGVDTSATPLHTATQYQETLTNGYTATLTGTGLSYDSLSDPGFFWPTGGVATALTLKDNLGNTVYVLSGISANVGDIATLMNGGNNWALVLENLLAGADNITGGGGADALAGFAGNDTIVGGGGDDTLSGGAGGDSLVGGAGENELYGGAGNDTLNGTGGVSYAIYEDASAAVSVNLATGIASDGSGGTDTLIAIKGAAGSAFADTLTGNSAANDFFGDAGNDTISGGSGSDTVYYDGAAGATVNLTLGQAQDGQGGSDTLISIENVEGSEHNDTLTGNSAANRLSGGGGDDTLDGTAGNDTLDGGANGGFGDTVAFSKATVGVTVNLTLGTASDGQGGSDILIGIEHIQGTRFGDNLTGDAGSNWFRPGAGNDSVDGKDGFDVVMYEGMGSAVTVNLQAGTASGTAIGSDTLVSIENVHGTSFGDNITLADSVTPGNAGGYVFARGGNDLLNGGAGNDNFIGGSGADTINGGAGSADRVSYAEDDFDNAGVALTGLGVTVNLGSGTATDNWGANDTLTGIENVAGSVYGDTLTGSAAANILEGNAGNDNLNGAAGNDLLLGGAGSDTLLGGAGNDTLDGGTVVDRINYSDLNMVSYAGSAAAVSVDLGSGVALDGLGGTDQLLNINVVIGSAFNDRLTGSAALQFEQFEGGAGNDTLAGGALSNGAGLKTNRVSYQNAGAAVTVDLLAGTAGGGAGSDTLSNMNQVRGSAFGDTLRGSNATLWTEQFEGRAGNDSIDGRGGFDIARYDNAGAAVSVNLATGSASDGYGGTDTLANIEGVRGSAFADTLVGGNAASGATLSDGLAESFMGMGGNDTIDGGIGYDRAEYSLAGVGVSVTLGGTADGSASDGMGGTDVLRNIEGVRGSNFNDTLTGSDSGAFESFEGRGGNDTINGRGGVDRADYQYAQAGVWVDLNEGSAFNDGDGGTDFLSNIEHLRGSAFNDTLAGNAAANKLDGGAGGDNLYGGAGNDTLLGGAGQDYLIGGAGNDSLDGGAIVDRINYTDLNLVDYGGSAAAVSVNFATGVALDGFGGTDTLLNIDFVVGSAFNDTLTGSGARIFEQFDGGAGNDTLTGGALANTLGLKNNRVNYQNAAAAVTVDLLAGTASGGAGSDMLININQARGSVFADQLRGSNATGWTEQFEGRGGNDTIDGRGGFDIVRYDNASGAVSVNLVTGSASGAGSGTDTLANIEGVRGSALNDLLVGGNAANGTSSASDSLSESFMGMGGNDTIDGGAGYDRAEYTLATAGVTVTLGGGVDGTAFDGQGGTDVLRHIEAVRGSSFNDTLNGSDTAVFESFEGRGGNDVINGRGGVDRADYQNASAAVTANLSTGSASDGDGGTDILAGIERLRGGNFNDRLTGNAVANRLEGGAGSDTLAGAAGADVLIGGSGADVFRFVTTAEGADLLSDFTSGSDKIQVVAANFGLTAGAAVTLLSGASTPAASGATAQFLYNSSSGALYFDRDGAGATYAASQIATLGTSKTLVGGDIQVVAG